MNQFDRPTYRDSVDAAISRENLTALASRTAEPQLLLGLALLARHGSPARKKILEKVEKADSQYAPTVAVLSVLMGSTNEKTIRKLIKYDPDNALGYYQLGRRLHDANQEDEALEAFRKAAHCSELRLYESITGDAFFTALDALKLHGRDRLCLSSWMAARSASASIACLQPLRNTLDDLGRSEHTGHYKEVSDFLVILAGHLFGTNHFGRDFGQLVLQSAFHLKAKVAAAEGSTKMEGYSAATRALASWYLRPPDMEDVMNVFQVAQTLPDRIHRALAMIDPSKRRMLGEMNVRLPDAEKAAFDRLVDNAIKTAETLLEIALVDSDELMGAYLRGIPNNDRDSEGHWIFRATPVEGLMAKRPNLFRAAAANENAMMALWRAGENDPERVNSSRLLEIGWAILQYASKHDREFPNNIDLLFEEGFLKPPLEATSPLTGRAYVYVGAGEKLPSKSSVAAEMVLLYDDKACQGWYHCFCAQGMASAIRIHELKKQLGKRGKFAIG